MAHVKRIESNLKGMTPTNLGPLTLIVGPNGSGKTARVQAIELAFTARVTGEDGGPISKGVDLMGLAPPGAGEITARAILSDGREVGTTIQGTTAKAKTPVRLGDATLAGLSLETLFPAAGVIRALGGSTATLRAALLQAGGRMMDDDELRGILGALADRVLEGKGSPVDTLLALRDTARQRRLDASREIKLVQEWEPPAGVPGSGVSENVVEEARAKIARIEAALPNALATLRAALEQRGEAMKAAVEAHPVPPAPASASSVLEVIKLCAHKSPARCPVCTSTPATAYADRLAQVEASIGAALEAHRLATDARDAAVAKVRIEAEETIASIEHKIDTAKTELSRLRGVVAGATAALAAPKGPTVAELRDRMMRATEALRDAERLEQAANDAIERVLDAAATRIGDAVRGAYGVGAEVAVRLRDGAREVCQIGLVRDGQIHTQLSGAEWARFVTALAVGMAGLGNGAPRIVATPDRAFDPKSLTAAMVAIAAVKPDVQVILQAVVEPTAPVPGWTVVRL